MTTSITPQPHYVFGKVKWFGGYNRKKECENDFGFLESFDKQDIFVHRKSLNNSKELDEGDLVLYRAEASKKGINATEVILLKNNDREILESLSKTLINESQRNFALIDVAFQSLLSRLLSGSLGETFFNFLTKDNNAIHLIVPIVRNNKYWGDLFTNRFSSLTFKDIENLGLTLTDIPKFVLDERIEELERHLREKSQLECNHSIDNIINHLSISAVLYFIFKNIITSSNQLLSRIEEVSKVVKDSVLHKKTNLNEFVRTVYSEQFSSFNHYAQHPIISPLISESLIKRKIFQKDMSFISDLQKNKPLLNKAEFYILSKIIPFLFEENTNKNLAIEIMVLNEIWFGLISGDIDLNDASILNLFPQCTVMSRVSKAIPLSCEAFHWTPKESQEDIFLCRGSRCINPQILPDKKRNFLEFTIYDWLAHYGISYKYQNKPSRKDFPIKLASYLNRLKVLFTRLHCRCCNTILKPNLSYARTEETVYNAYSRKFETVNISPAYRVTVFECGNETCQQFAQGVYLTHCCNNKCPEIIDSRDSQIKCDNNRYVCMSCRSCCAEHDKNKVIN
jgi:cold shock CspA family protein